MKAALGLVFGGLTLVLSACSSDQAAAPAGQDAGSGGSAGGGGTSGAAGNGGAAGSTEAGATIEVKGKVVDASTSTGFDATKYTALADVDVCVYEDNSVPCVKTNATGDYDLKGAPAGKAFYLSFKKTGSNSTLYAVAAGTASPVNAPAIIMGTPGLSGDFAQQAGITVDSTKGTILFGAVTPGTKSDSQFYEEFGGQGFIYVQGYQVVPTPAATHGPFYVSPAWKIDKTLQESSAAGWGFITAAPGDYTLKFSHPTLNCGSTTTKVVAGYDTTYVGTACTAPADGGASDGGGDAAPGDSGGG